MTAAQLYSTDEVREPVPEGGEYRPRLSAEIIHMIFSGVAFIVPTIYYGGQLTARLDGAANALHNLEQRVDEAQKSQAAVTVQIALLQDEFKIFREENQQKSRK